MEEDTNNIDDNYRNIDKQIEKVEDKTEDVSITEMLEKDITYRDLPDDVKEYFQHYLDKISQTDVRYKTYFKLVQEAKNAITSGYMRDILLAHIVKIKDSFKDKENPDEWIRQINPSLFTKLDKFIATNKTAVADLCDDTLDDDFDKDHEISLQQITIARKVIKKKKQPKPKIIDAEYEVVKDE